MNVLVTGGTGSLGSWVLHRLVDAGHAAVAFDARVRRTYIADILDDVTVVEGDVLDRTQLSRVVETHDIDRIIHLAKVVGRRGEEDPFLALRVNVLGSGNVLQTAATHGVERVVFTSSKSVLAAKTGSHAPPTFEPVDEGYPTFERDDEGVPFYSTTNKMVEYFGNRFAMNSDVEFVVTRFGSNYGPGKLDSLRRWHDDSDGMTLATPSFLAGEMTNRAIDGRSIRIATDYADNFVYTKDLASGLVKAVTSDRIRFENNHREFLLDGGMIVSLSDFAAALSERFPGVSLSVGDGGIELTSRRNSACKFDISRAKRELGYEPSYDLDAAIDDYVETELAYA